jgi:pimeloyl-ACP methyl ester carboxylesterase
MLAYYRAALRGALRPIAPPRPIDAPGLLLWAEEDPALGTELISPHLAFARSLRVERVPRCGHFVQIERPDEVSARLLRWLADTDVTA